MLRNLFTTLAIAIAILMFLILSGCGTLKQLGEATYTVGQQLTQEAGTAQSGYTDTSNGSQMKNAGTFSAIVDGKPWKADVAQSSSYNKGEQMTLQLLGHRLHGEMIKGTAYDQIGISLKSNPFKGPGTYPLTGCDITFGQVWGEPQKTDDSSSFHFQQGEMTLTAIDNQGAKGTFHLTATNPQSQTLNITDGVFDVVFGEETRNPGVAQGNDFELSWNYPGILRLLTGSGTEQPTGSEKE